MTSHLATLARYGSSCVKWSAPEGGTDESDPTGYVARVTASVRQVTAVRHAGSAGTPTKSADSVDAAAGADAGVAGFSTGVAGFSTGTTPPVGSFASAGARSDAARSGSHKFSCQFSQYS